MCLEAYSFFSSLVHNVFSLKEFIVMIKKYEFSEMFERICNFMTT